jgi:hypothetical protein
VTLILHLAFVASTECGKGWQSESPIEPGLSCLANLEHGWKPIAHHPFFPRKTRAALPGGRIIGIGNRTASNTVIQLGTLSGPQTTTNVGAMADQAAFSQTKKTTDLR